MAFVPGRGLAEVAAQFEKARAATRVRGAGMEISDESLRKLRWLEGDERNFRLANDVMQRRMSKAYAAALDLLLTGRGDPSAPTVAAVTEFRNVVAERLATSGGDVPVRPNAPATVKRKGHGRVGDDTGTLKREMKTAKVRPVR